MKHRKFAPFFWTQFWGAFNDNVYKNALLIMFAVRAASEERSGELISIAGGLFILPFVLFSGIAGQIADQFPKVQLIRITKAAEVFVMGCAVLGFLLQWEPLLLLVLFLMGLQSTFFGPVKYSILPEQFEEKELVAANAMIEMGTFLAILTGTTLGGAVASNVNYACVAVMTVALFGLLTSFLIPNEKTPFQRLDIDFHPIRQFQSLYHAARQNQSTYLSIIAISWFWFVGAVILSQLPTFVKFVLGGDETVMTLTMTWFTMSLALGAILSSHLSKDGIEPALVILGAFGLTVPLIDLWVCSYPYQGTELLNITRVLQSRDSFFLARITTDILALGICGSLYIIPLYAMLQQRSSPGSCSRVVAANNVINSLFMVISSISVGFFYGQGLGTASVFGLVGILNMIFNLGLLYIMPEFLYRLLFWFKGWRGWTADIQGGDVPRYGPVVILSELQTNTEYSILLKSCQRSIPLVLKPSQESRLRFPGRTRTLSYKYDALALIHKSLRENEAICLLCHNLTSAEKEEMNRILRMAHRMGATVAKAHFASGATPLSPKTSQVWTCIAHTDEQNSQA
ncbi:MAG: MFS transporter [Oligoflexales bacterium]